MMNASSASESAEKTWEEKAKDIRHAHAMIVNATNSPCLFMEHPPLPAG
jgi:hypothetical protein